MNSLKSIMDFLSDINICSVAVRIFLATFMGGCIGMNRFRHGRAAGARTHILVCLGAAITTLLGFYTAANLGFPNDPLRLGAQVVSGIGFLGVGTIMIRNHSQVTGLTTAAGLWTTACIGLTIGAGFYEVALIAFVTVLLTFTLLSSLEGRIKRRANCAYYIEITDIRYAGELYDAFSRQLSSAEIVPAKSGLPNHVGMELVIEDPKLRQSFFDSLRSNEHIAVALPRQS